MDSGVLNLDLSNQSMVGKYASAFAIIILVISCLLLFRNANDRYQDFRNKEQQLATNAVTNTASEIELYIANSRHLSQLFLPSHEQLIREAVIEKDNDQSHQLLNAKVSEYFPEARNFTIADKIGLPVLDDPNSFIGNACRKDLKKYAISHKDNEIFIHANPQVLGSSHFDILSQVDDIEGNLQGIFFVSLKTDVLQRLLSRGRIPGHQLMLIRPDKDSKIDLTEEGPNLLLDREPLLTTDELDRVVFSSLIEGSQWQLIDLPIPSHFSDTYRSLIIRATGFSLLFTIFSFVLLMVILREEGKRKNAEHLLFQEHAGLEANVQRRTAELIESQKELSYQAMHDSLTGLVNRREFGRRLNSAIEKVRQERSESALLYLDLDQFKLVNDTCGHLAGDELLCRLSRKMKKALRGSDTLARLGGDEFGVIMESCDSRNAKRTADNLRQVVKDSVFTWEGKKFEVGVSIGLVIIDEHTGHAAEIMTAADTACYAAKELGRNRVYTYKLDDEALEHRRTEMGWVSEIHQAVKEDLLVLYCQPIIPITESLSQPWYEILVRMENVNGDLIAPGAFIPAAERYGKVIEIDFWVINHTLRFLSDLQINTPLFLSINLSGQTINHEDTLKYIQERFQYWGVNPSSICFEITETAAISNFANALNFIDHMKTLGCKLALDDFGSGLCSFAYLRDLEVDYLKIDGAIVRGIDQDKTARSIFEAISGMANALNKPVIAEFAETKPIIHELESLGIGYAQGYYYGTPEKLTANLVKTNHQND